MIFTSLLFKQMQMIQKKGIKFEIQPQIARIFTKFVKIRAIRG
jgi:hypothetical protein